MNSRTLSKMSEHARQFALPPQVVWKSKAFVMNEREIICEAHTVLQESLSILQPSKAILTKCCLQEIWGLSAGSYRGREVHGLVSHPRALASRIKTSHHRPHTRKQATNTSARAHTYLRTFQDMHVHTNAGCIVTQMRTFYYMHACTPTSNRSQQFRGINASELKYRH